jgi:hypothetical protein
MKYSHISSALVTVSLIGLCLLACGPKQGTDQGKIASLPDLPQADVDKLKLVPNTHFLATSQVQRPSNPPPVAGPPPPCPADSTETDYTAQVLYPITVCRSLVLATEETAGSYAEFYIDRLGPTSKVANSKLPTELQGIAGNAPGAQASNLWWACRTEKGPWQGYLTESHLCVGTCSAVFSLQLTNAPNPMVWAWDLNLDNHNFDPNFQFVGTPVSLGTTDYGSCHQPPPPSPSH